MNLKVYFDLKIRHAQQWAVNHVLFLVLFNIILIFLFLLRSVGYFDPFLSLSINTIVIISLLLAILLLGAGSSLVLIISLAFWLLAAFLKVVRIDIWAERTSIYAYQALLIGVGLLVLKSIWRTFNLKK